MGESTQRILIVGWDGGTWRVFRPLAEKGLMPRLKDLMDRGSFGTMTSTIPPITPPAWTTLLTGLKPERHGIFGFLEGVLNADSRREVRERSRPVSSLSVRQKSLVDILGEAGRRSMLINVPMTWPPRPLKGIMVTGMLTPPSAGQFTWPPELKDELIDYAIDIIRADTIEERSTAMEVLDEATYVKRCKETLRNRKENILRLGRKHPWDFALVIFTATDRIFHRFWPEALTLAESGGPSTETEKLLLDFFVELDTSLGEVLDAFGEGVTMLVSDHGFAQRAEHSVFVDLYLKEKGFLVPRRGAPGRSFRRALRGFARRSLEKLLPPMLVTRLRVKVDDRQTRLLRSLDATRSVACFAGFDGASYGAVKLLEAATVGLSAEQRSALMDRICMSLKEMRDPGTDEFVLVDARRTDEVFEEAVVDFLPEIVLEFREGYTGRTDPDATELLGPSPRDCPIGAHHIDGMFVLGGDPARKVGGEPTLHLADIAPTVLYLAGLPVPSSMQGKVPLGLFTDEHTSSHPLREIEAAEADMAVADTPGGAYTPDQEDEVKKRLRQLGYLE